MIKKKVLYVFAAILAVFLCLWGLNLWLENKVVNELRSSFGDALVYEKIQVDLLRGRVLMDAPGLDLRNFKFTAEELEIKGFGYFECLSSDNVVIQKIEVEKPGISFYTRDSDTSETSRKIQGGISVRHFELSEGKLNIAETDTTKSLFYAAIAQLHLKNILLNKESLKEKLPFSFEEYEVAVDSLFLNVNEEHYMTLGNLSVKEEVLNAADLRLIPKFSKVEFQKHIPYEKDRFELRIEAIAMDSLNWGFENDSLYIKNHLLSFKNADLEVYRNKLLKDDPREKTLYGEKIRSLPFKIDLEMVEVTGSQIVYEELTKEEMGPAVVDFTRVYGKIYNLSNTGMEEGGFPTTEMDAKAYLMGESLLDFHLEFDVRDPGNRYSFNGSTEDLSSAGINSFLRPALGVEAEGGIESLAFNFTGNEEAAKGDMQLRYKDFKISILKDEGEEKAGILSAVVNLFVNNSAMNEEALREDLVVERDKTKSFWNLVWSCIEKGAINSLL